MAEDPKKVLTLEDEGAPEPPPPDPPVPLAQTIKKVAIMGFASFGLFGIFFGGGMTATYLLREPPPEIVRGGKVLVLPVSPQSQGQDGLAMGVTHVLVDALQGVEGLEVIDKAETLKLVGDESTAAELAAKFEARYVVQAAVKQTEGSARFDVSLFLFGNEGETSGAVFMEQLKRPTTEFYGALDEGIRMIPKGTNLELEVSPTMARATEKPDAWIKALNSDYICTNAEDGDKQKEVMTKAFDQLTAVSGTVTDWGGAHAALARCGVAMGEKGHLPAEEATAKAKAAAMKAIELDAKLLDDAAFKALAEAVGATGEATPPQ